MARVGLVKRTAGGARNRERKEAGDLETISLMLTGMAPTGEAIGRHAGMVVFVPFGLAGEEVRVRLVERKRNFARGEIVELLAQAPARVVPPCPYFGRCGGCE